MGSNKRYGLKGEPPPAQPRRIRHVWVTPSRQYGDMTPWPGLLIEWRRADTGEWTALVAVVASGNSSLTVHWFAADMIRPASTP